MENISRNERPSTAAVKALGVAFAVLASVVAAQWYQISKLESRKASAADSVVVVDYMQLAMRDDPGMSDSEAEQKLIRLRNMVDGLAEAGFIVLDSKAVLKAPKDAYLHELMPSEGE